MVSNYLKTYQSHEIESIWHEIEPLVKKVLIRHEEDYTIESIKRFLLEKNAQLWTSYSGQIEAILLTHIAIYPNHKTCDIFLCSGTNYKNWLHFLSFIEKWAKGKGCKYVRFQGRKGWKKLIPEYTQTKIIMQRAL